MKLVQFYPTDNKAEFKKFIQLPWDIYKNDKNWVPPLRLQVLDDLDVKKNPFYHHADITLWNAYQDGRHVGRIAAILDERHNQIHNEKACFFGFFESENNPEVIKKLFSEVEMWGKARGMKILRGPANPSLNHTAGLLVDGFQRKPYVMMTYNPPYYAKLLEQEGFYKAKDVVAYEIDPKVSINERYVRIARKIAQKEKIKIRSINMKDFKNEVKRIKAIYNDAWEHNWGFVPVDDLEFDHMAKSMKDVLWPDFCLLAEIEGEPVGFSLTIPNINQILEKIPNGKLLPFGIFKLIWGMNPKRGVITELRTITLGVKKNYRATGVANIFYVESFERAKKYNMQDSEVGWVLEDNRLMRSPIENLGGVPYKTYRIYDKVL